MKKGLSYTLPDLLIDDGSVIGAPRSLKSHFTAVSSLRDTIIRKQTEGADNKSDIAQLGRLVRDVGVSAFYKSLQDRIIDDFKKNFTSIPTLRDAIKIWPHMNRHAQKQFLQNCVRLLAACQSESGIPVKPARLRWVSRLKMKHAQGNLSFKSMVSDDKSRLKLWIEMQSKNQRGIKDFPTAIELVAHEQTHSYQLTLARAVLKGRIKQDDPLYRDALLFAYNLTSGYIRAKTCCAAYRAQPAERDAFDTSFKAHRIAADCEWHISPYSP